MINSTRSLIAFHEGCTLKAIPDRHGLWSIGYGKDGAKPSDTCTQQQAEEWLDTDLALATLRAMGDLGDSWGHLDPVRRAAMIDAAYELGGAGLAKFTHMLQAIRLGDWVSAAHEALNSEWAAQVPLRAKMDAAMLLTGEWPKNGTA